MMGKTCHTSKILQTAKAWIRLFLAAALILQPGVNTVHPAQAAATRTVNTLADTSGGNCSGGICSLRDAISLSADGDRIEFAVTGTITLTSAITSDKSLTIAGPGSDKLTLSGNNTTRVFFFTGDSTKTVSLSGMTIANGYYSAVTTNNIHTAAHLILDHMVFFSEITPAPATATRLPPREISPSPTVFSTRIPAHHTAARSAASSAM
jgi:CSLREA domain-containing protein